MKPAARWAVGLWLAGVLACAAIIARTEFTTDLSAFLPRSPTPEQRILVDQLREGVVSRLILLAIEGAEGAPPAALAPLSKDFARRLRAETGFASVNNGEEVGIEKDRDFLWRNRYLLSSAVAPERFSVAGLRQALETDLQLLGSPAGMLVKRVLANDPTGELLFLLQQFEGEGRPVTRDGVWFSRDGTRALLVAQSRAAGFDLDAQEQTLALTRAHFRQAAEASGAQGARLLISGPALFSVDSRDKIKQDAWRISLLAAALVSGMLFLVYRSLRVLSLALLPVATGALAGVTAVSLGFGSVHGITLGFGATLIGEAVDYAIYLFTQSAPGSPPEKTLSRIWPTLRLGVLTSICGFSTMLFSGFTGLAQLGLFSIAGLVAAVSVTRWVLPVLLPRDFAAASVAGFSSALMAVVRHAPRLRTVLLLAVAAALFFIGVRHGDLWDDELSSLSPVSQAAQRLDEQLRRDLGAPDLRFLVVAMAGGEQQVLETSEKLAVQLQALRRQGLIGGYDSPTVYLPSRAAQRERQAALLPADALRGNLRWAQTGLPYRADLFEPFLQDAAAAKTQALLDRDSLQGTNLALKLESLLVKREAGWMAMLPLRGVTDPLRLGREIPRLAIPGVALLDLKTETDGMFRTYRREALMLSLLGVLVIVVLLAISLRSPRRVYEVLAPLAAAVILTTALLLSGGHSLSIFHLVGLLLVVAVGSNYCLFFDRQNFFSQDRERTIVSLALANFSTVIGFGLLSFARAPVLQAIGTTVGIGAILSLVFAAALTMRSGGDAPQTAESIK